MNFDLRDVDQLARELVEAHGSVDAVWGVIDELGKTLNGLQRGKRDTIAKTATRHLRLVERVFHGCPDGYTAFLCAADTCARCGWSPLVPIPDIQATARGLVTIYGEDALLFVTALANVIEEELRGNRR